MKMFRQNKNDSMATDLKSQLSEKSKLWPWLVLLVVLVVLPYAQIESHQFINWDDPDYVFNNPIVSAGLSWWGIGWAFTTGFLANWHPLTWLSHMLDASLFGPTSRAAHLINLVWYLGCVILAFFLFLRLNATPVAAFFMAAFFGLHPLHVESVAWAAERKDLLCAFFFLSATLAYLDYAHQPNRTRYFLLTGLFILSLLAKPMAVTWPCVALLLDYWPLKRINELGRAIYEKIPWFVLSIISSVITLIVQSEGKAVASMVDYPLATRLANATISYLEYIRQTILPIELTVFYPYPYTINIFSVLVACCTLCLMTAVAIWQWRKRPYMLLGWLFYLGVLVPVSGIIQVGNQGHADRYTLLPQLGLVLAIGFLLDKILIAKNIRRTAAIIISVVIVVLMALTFRQVSYWQDSKTLFSQNLAVAGENDLAHFNLGTAYYEGNQLELAITHFLAAARMNPNDVTTYNNMGMAYAKLNQVDLAEAAFKQAIFLDPQKVQPRFQLACLKISQGNFGEAVQQLDEALRIAPDWREARELRNKARELSSGRSTSSAIVDVP